MLKLTKKADYGLIAMKHLAERALAAEAACSAKEIAEAYSLPAEALAKILQRLAKRGLLVSQHGTNGGYALARDARAISALEVIEAIEGRPYIAACMTDEHDCEQLDKCTIRHPLRRVNESIEEVLGRLSVADLMEPAPQPGHERFAPELVTLH
jgi:Rrf2 family protein